MVDPQPEVVRVRKRRRKRPYIPVTLAIAGLLSLGAGAALLVGRRPDARQPALHAALPAPLITTGFPEPTPSASAGVPDGLRIKIPELKVDLPVIQGDGVNAPLYKAAVYPAPLLPPGHGGRSMVYAHARPGMFAPLFNAGVGQHIEIDQPGGTTLRYVVTEYYRRWPVSDLRWLQAANHEELILETCTTYNPNDPRIIVVAEPA